jgi:microcompartment protein CcmL/EutN
VVVSGDVAAVKASVAAGVETAGCVLVDSIVIPNVHEQVIGAISASTEIGKPEALGIMETFSLSSAVICADAAVKAAAVQLIEVRLGRGRGGKSLHLPPGEVAAAKAAIEAAKAVEEAQGMVAGTVVIPSPHPDILQAVF